MITDRDICIATATKHRTASAIAVRELVSGKLHFCLPEDDLTTALLLMQTEQVRRLPVVNARGILQGILSINDVILYAEKSLHGKKKTALSYAEVLKTLKGICAHR